MKELIILHSPATYLGRLKYLPEAAAKEGSQLDVFLCHKGLKKISCSTSQGEHIHTRKHTPTWFTFSA